MKFIRSGSTIAIFLAMLLATFCRVDASSGTRSWQSDLDWSSWTMTNVKPVGGNLGLELSQTETGGYKTDGNLEFHFAPGTVSQWKSAEIDSSVTSAESTQYAFLPIESKGTVSQVDISTGQVVREWDVGVGPTAVAISPNNDVWVANSSRFDDVYCAANPSDTGCAIPSRLQKLNTISHIIPSQNRVITKKIVFADNSTTSANPRSISVDKDGKVYVGLFNENELVEIDGTKFDNSDNYLSQIISLSGSPFGSVFGSDGRLYIAYLNSGVAKFNTSSAQIETFYDRDENGNLTSAYGVNADNFGNIWFTSYTEGKILRIDHTDSSIKSFSLFSPGVNSLNNPAQVAIIPGSTASLVKVAVSFMAQSSLPSDPAGLSEDQKWGRVAIGDLVDNDSVNPTVSGLSLYSSGCGVVSGRAISGDSIGNIWYAPNSSCTSKLKVANSYNSSQILLPNNSFNAAAMVYNGFIGNSTSPVSDTTISVAYSSRAFSPTNLGTGEISKVENSEDLFIKVSLHGTINVSPIIKSLKINFYAGDALENGEMVRRITYSDKDRKTEEATFENGETVYVRLLINESLEEKNNFELSDVVDHATFDKNKTAGFTDSAGNSQALNLTINQNKASFILPKLTVGLNTLDYEYVATD